MLPWIRSWFTIIASTPIHLGSFTISYKERKKVKEKMVIQVKISLIPDVKSKNKKIFFVFSTGGHIGY